MVYPKKDLWKRENKRSSSTNCARSIPMRPALRFNFIITPSCSSSYEEAARYSLIAIAILVFIHFRSALSVALSLIPVAVGVICSAA